MKAACGPDPVAVLQTLQEGAAYLSRAGVESARLDAELLLAEALGLGRDKLYLKHETALDLRAQELFRSLLSRRVGGEPVAYITGRREFWSLDFHVTPAVLVPRPETELLVEVAVRLIRRSPILDFGPWILDLGTGSGAIAVSLVREITDVEIWATDVSLEAIEIAQANARRHGVEEKIHFFSGDLFEPVRDQRGFFNMIVFNPPYVRRTEIDRLPREVRDFEPRIALDGGSDGLDFYREIIRQGHFYLVDDGFIVLEIGADMAEEVSRLFADSRCYSPARVRRDYAGKDRVISARKLFRSR